MRKVRAGTRGLPGWAPDCKSRPRVPPLPALSAQALPSPSSISAPPPKAPSNRSPPGQCSCRSLCQECLPLATVQVAAPDPVLQPPEHCTVIVCLACGPGQQDRAVWSPLCYHPTSTEERLCSAVCSAPPRVYRSCPPLWVSAPTDQSPGKDSEAWVPDSEERLILREEFTSRMHQRFLDGKDGDFDYR